MKIVVLTLANDEVCVCGRCTGKGNSLTNPALDGGGRSYKPMIEAIRNTWAYNPPEGIKTYYIYGHRKGIEFPKDSKYRETEETYWPNNVRKDVTSKRYPFAIDDCIYSDTPEGRENIYYKTIDGFEWLLENEDFDYLVRCCAGTYLDLKILKQYLEKIGIKDNIYSGSPGIYPNSHNPTQPPQIKFASGSAFIASRNLIEDLVSRRNTIEHVRSPHAEKCIGDDVTFGKHFIHDLGVELIPFWKYECRSIHEVTDKVKDYMQCYFLHSINPEMLYAVHRAKGLASKKFYRMSPIVTS
tara:strand:- start:3688 stop:4581 length:894 start_codon:yes stop_codon:yes gene_type:complete